MNSSGSIAAGASDSSTALGAVKRRLAIAMVALLLFAAFALMRALAEPSTGWQFDVDAQGQVVATRISNGAQLRNVTSVQGVQSKDSSGAPLLIPLDASVMRETGGLTLLYSEHAAFYQAHANLWRIVTSSPEIVVRHAGGEQPLAVRAKALDELGLRFWFPWAFGLLAFSVGLAVWIYRPVDHSAAWYLLASASYAFWMMVVAGTGSRLLTQPAVGFQALHVACHTAAHLYLMSLCMLLWRFPSLLNRPAFSERHLMTILLVWTGFFTLVDALEWVAGINWGFRLPNLAIAGVLTMLFFLQWRESKGSPLKRAPLRWLGFLLVMTLSMSFLTTLFILANRLPVGRIAYGFASMSLIFLGFVPLVTRLKLFKLELWWSRAWLWFLGGVLVILVDVMLARLFTLNASASLALALVLAGWLYFPLRQWLWQRFSRSALPSTSDVLPQIVALSAVMPNAGNTEAHALAWMQVWETQFQPQSLRSITGVELLSIDSLGQLLHIPALGNLPALELGMPLRGSRLYNLEDLQRAREIDALVRRSQEATDALARGAQMERQRIAADLHDDLGAKLLTITQVVQAAERLASNDRVADLARQALDDMRLAVRGFHADAVLAKDAQADWRGELMQRLFDANIETHWHGGDAPQGLRLSPNAQLQLTRVLRETVSNVIRHSHATACELGVQWSANELMLYVQDNGIGLPQAQLVSSERRGLGLSNIERRIHKLNGFLQWQAAQPTGLRMQATIPLRQLVPDTSISSGNISL